MRKKKKKMWSLVSSLNFSGFPSVSVSVTRVTSISSSLYHDRTRFMFSRKPWRFLLNTATEEGRTFDKKSVGAMSRTNLHCKITHLIVTQYTCSHHVVSKPRFGKYNYNSISNRNGHQPASHDTRLHANRGLATITKKSISGVQHLKYYSGFQMTVEKPKPKQLLRPITTGANSAMTQSQFLAIIWDLPKAREKSRVHGAIGFGFASHWLKN